MEKVSDHFNVPPKVELDKMDLLQLRKVGQSLNAQRQAITDLYRKATEYLQARIVQQTALERDVRRKKNPKDYDAKHQGVG